MVTDACDEEVCEVADSGGFLVEAGHSGKHRGARPTDSDHIFQLDESQRRFAWDEDQRAAFFEVHICGALDEVGGVSAGDGGEGTHGAGANDHAIGEAGAAGDGAGVISGAILNECSGVVCGTGLGFEGAKVPVSTGFSGGDFLDQVVPCGAGRGDGGKFDVQFLSEDLPGGAADDEVNGTAGFEQHLQQSDGVEGSGGTSDGDDDLSILL